MQHKTSNARCLIEAMECRRLLSAAVTTLLQDYFSASTLNTSIWHQPSSGPGSFLGRTQLQVLGHSPAPTVSGGTFQPNLQSYNPTQLPNQPSFWGSEIISNKSLILTAGKTLDVKFRAKLNMTVGGGVLGLFLYEYNANAGGDHDEADVELLSNSIANGQNSVETNVYANQPLGAGLPAALGLPGGGKLAGWHTYEMKLDGGVSVGGATIVAPSLSWYVDGKFLRRETTAIPTHAMNLYVNFWAPDQGWEQAENPALLPTSNPAQNRKWTANVDSVIVTSSTDAIPFTASRASVILANADPTQGKADSATGTIQGSGNGTVTYYWDVEHPNGSVAKASGTLTATMKNGVASVPKFSGLPTSVAGSYSVWIHILSPGTGVDGSKIGYVVMTPTPTLTITSVSPYGTDGDVTGVVSGVNLADYQGVAVDIEVAGGWWVKPFADAPISPISSSGGWDIHIDTGGADQDATNVAVFLIPIGFQVPILLGEPSLPSSLLALLHTEVARS